MNVQHVALRGMGSLTQVRHHRFWEVLFSRIVECLLCCIEDSVCGVIGGLGLHNGWEVVPWNGARQIRCLVCWWMALLSSGSVGVGLYFILDVGDGGSGVLCPVVGWWIGRRGWNGSHWRDTDICATPSYTAMMTMTSTEETPLDQCEPRITNQLYLLWC